MAQLWVEGSYKRPQLAPTGPNWPGWAAAARNFNLCPGEEPEVGWAWAQRHSEPHF